jgi:hypothetical protein
MKVHIDEDVQSFGLKLAQPRFLSISSLTKINVRELGYSAGGKRPFLLFPQISCQIFHTRNEHGPDENGRIFFKQSVRVSPLR